MKLLLIGSNNQWSIEKHYYVHLSEYYVIKIFAAQNLLYQYLNRHIGNKVLYKLGLSSIYARINKELRAFVEEFKPDVVLIFKGMEVLPGTLRWMKRRGIIIANYNPDNPFIFSGAGSGNKNISDSIGLYDLHFTYNLDVKSKIEKEYNLPVYWLPFGYNIPMDVFERSRQIKEVNKACLIGNPDARRVELLKYLSSNGVQLDVYGNDWQKYISHPNISIFKPVYEPDLYLLLRQYRVQLNPLRPHNLTSHAMRSFEVPAIGGIILSEDTQEHRLLFEESKEAFFYSGLEDCLKKVNHLLSLSVEDADKIRRNARERSITSKYDYRSRSASVKLTLDSFYASKRDCTPVYF